MNSEATSIGGPPAARVVPGRECGACTLCCKVVAVVELDKPAGTWCAHARSKSGCGIYEMRPPGCRTFYCHWMLDRNFGPEWKPDKAKFALMQTPQGVTAFVDPGHPAAWRRSPYYESLKRWAIEGAREGRIVAIRVGTRAHVVLPDRDVDIGIMAPDESLQFAIGPNGILDVRKVSQPAA